MAAVLRLGREVSGGALAATLLAEDYTDGWRSLGRRAERVLKQRDSMTSGSHPASKRKAGRLRLARAGLVSQPRK